MSSPSYSNVSVAATATLILSANSGRKGSLITNNGTVTVYLGMDSSVTTTNGIPLPAGATFENSGYYDRWGGAVYGIVATGTCDVRYMEWGPS